MSKISPIGITEKSGWDKKWEDIFEHYQQDKRHAYYINSILDDKDHKVLEIGAGSFRDMAELNRLGIDCDGTDYSPKAVDLACKTNPSLAHKIFQSDAFNMFSIPDKYYESTFHNGLWILFNNDSDLINLAKEQKRITKRKMIITVHNGHNLEFVDYFKRLASNDDLYKIRFFRIDEILQILGKIIDNVQIIPVGKGKRFHEDELINLGNYDRASLSSCFKAAEHKFLEISERLMCVCYL